jgi:hypothetical protein
MLSCLAAFATDMIKAYAMLHAPEILGSCAMTILESTATTGVANTMIPQILRESEAPSLPNNP